MISILVCSIDPLKLSNFEKNIAQTIGIPFEIIAFNNRLNNWGISKVYNHLAIQAKYEYLCFCHEDVEFLSRDWGEIILNQLSLPESGVVGFAGSKAKSKTFSGWGGGNHRNRRFNLTEVNKNGVETVYLKSYGEEPFAQVVVLDGFCLFTKKIVWKEFPFDEEILQNFHLYDLDFSLQVASKYKNYVNMNIKVRHMSSGSYSENWLYETAKFHEKWNAKLPIYLKRPCRYIIETDEIKAKKDFMRLLNSGGDRKFEHEIKNCIQDIKKNHFWNHYALKILINYYVYKKI